MNNSKLTTIALCYDFDKTLSPENMQEYGFIQKLGMTPNEFWAETAKISNKHFSDYVNSYMYYMIKAYKEHGFELTKQSLFENGKVIELFEGLDTWFKRINEFGENPGINSFKLFCNRGAINHGF